MPRHINDVVVIGSGPNGLAAAVLCARAGLDVQVLEDQPTPGGGCRTEEIALAGATLPHDLCSAVHPMAAASPFFTAFDLTARGVQLNVPTASYAHPLDHRRAGIAYPDLSRTAAELAEYGTPADAAAWQNLLHPLVDDFTTLVALCLGDMRSIPPDARDASGARTALGFAARVLEQGTRAGNRRFTDDMAPAMLTGIGGHVPAPLPSLAGAASMLLLGSAAHTVGWPIPTGGSQAITGALIDDLHAHGGHLDCDQGVSDWRLLPHARPRSRAGTTRAHTDEHRRAEAAVAMNPRRLRHNDIDVPRPRVRDRRRCRDHPAPRHTRRGDHRAAPRPTRRGTQSSPSHRSCATLARHRREHGHVPDPPPRPPSPHSTDNLLPTPTTRGTPS